MPRAAAARTKPTEPTTSRARIAKPRKAAEPSRPESAEPTPRSGGEIAVRALARQLQQWTGALLGGVGNAADLSLTLAAAASQRPGTKATVARAAGLLRDARQAAGLTLDDLGRVLQLKDPGFIAQVESGKAGLPFEMILRLATVLGRNDPVTFVMQLTRSYNPRVWQSLEALGVGKLLVQAGREREFANIYRARQDARGLSDAQFATALAFTASAFDTAMAFLRQQERSPGRVAPAGDGTA